MTNGKSSLTETRLRSITKGISWRIWATMTSGAIAWMITRDVEKAGWIMVLDAIIKFILYYGHERAWNVVAWGRLAGKPTAAAE